MLLAFGRMRWQRPGPARHAVGAGGGDALPGLRWHRRAKPWPELPRITDTADSLCHPGVQVLTVPAGGIVAPDGSAATVASCIGVALGLLDQWLAGHDSGAPARLAPLTRLPAGHWTGERAARDILTLARKGRAFASLDSLIARQGGRHVLYGSALTLAAALQAWSRHTGTPLIDLARTAIR